MFRKTVQIVGKSPETPSARCGSSKHICKYLPPVAEYAHRCVSAFRPQRNDFTAVQLCSAHSGKPKHNCE